MSKACGGALNLSVLPFNNGRLGDAQVAAAVVPALKSLSTIGDVIYQGMGLIMNLSTLDANNPRLGEAGACDVVVRALEEFPGQKLG